MPQVIFEVVMDERLRKRIRNAGILMLIIGLIGVVLPQFMSFTLSVLIAVLLIAAGLISLYLTWYSYNRSLLAWFKPFALLLVGLLMAFYPMAGAAAIGLLLVMYFLLAAFAGISLALALRPMPGWGWTLFSGLLSLALAVLFLIGWPFSSAWLVGLFVGINLIFDGVALLMLAQAAR
jgi:uncharacterized membrane protein HdeD (DUF308 family)